MFFPVRDKLILTYPTERWCYFREEEFLNRWRLRKVFCFQNLECGSLCVIYEPKETVLFSDALQILIDYVARFVTLVTFGRSRELKRGLSCTHIKTCCLRDQSENVDP